MPEILPSAKLPVTTAPEVEKARSARLGQK